MRALIAEDDAALGLFLKKGLETEGHEVTLVCDGNTALRHAVEQQPDLMVLDLGLPQMDGIAVLEAMQGRCNGTVVLVLTGHGDVTERVKCLNLGADFLLKPFSFFELTARCRALLRRGEQFANPMLQHGGLELNRIKRTVVRDGVAIDLTAKEFSLLEFLLQNRGRTCSRAQLLEHVWRMAPNSGANVVDVYINYLRKKLAGAHAEGHAGDDLIETVRGEGYVLGGYRKRAPMSHRFELGQAALHG